MFCSIFIVICFSQFLVIKSEFSCNKTICEVTDIHQQSKDVQVDIFNNKTFEQDNVKTINFRNSSFFNLPTNIFTTYHRLTELNAERLGLVTIKENTFQSAKALKKLNLSFNNFKELFDVSFIGAVVLQELDLSNNQIINIDSKTFQSIKSLEKLNLSKNNISIIKKDHFLNVIRVHDLNLSFNKLTYIEQSSFEKITFLHSLNLSNNLLSEFSENLQVLQILDIQNNKLTTLTIDSYLSRLYAQKNQISNLKIAPNYSNQLNFLNISYNKLDSIANMYYLRSLATLDASFNEFRQEIPSESINKLINLQYLYLEGNNIIKFQYNDLQLRYLKEITLPTINFDCDFLKSMIDYFNSKKIQFNGNLTDCGGLTTTIGPIGTDKPSTDDDSIEKKFESLNRNYKDLILRVEYLERNISFKIILGFCLTLILLYVGYRLFQFYSLNLRYRNHQPLSDRLTETFDISMHPL